MLLHDKIVEIQMADIDYLYLDYLYTYTHIVSLWVYVYTQKEKGLVIFTKMLTHYLVGKSGEDFFF